MSSKFIWSLSSIFEHKTTFVSNWFVRKENESFEKINVGPKWPSSHIKQNKLKGHSRWPTNHFSKTKETIVVIKRELKHQNLIVKLLGKKLFQLKVSNMREDCGFW